MHKRGLAMNLLNAFLTLMYFVTNYYAFFHAYLLGLFAVRQIELRLTIRLTHLKLFHYNKRANIIHDV